MRLEIASSGSVNQHTNIIEIWSAITIYNPNPNNEEQGATYDPVQSQVQPTVQCNVQLSLLITRCYLVIHCINFMYSIMSSTSTLNGVIMDVFTVMKTAKVLNT